MEVNAYALILTEWFIPVKSHLLFMLITVADWLIIDDMLV